MKTFILAISLASLIGLAQAASHEHDTHPDTSSHAEHAVLHQGKGMVKAVGTNKIQIAHEPIPSLEWPAMTMWFELQEHVGQDIQVGNHVSFKMKQGKNKKWVIEMIERK
jgi:Cu/Ag efflux protein CusF